MTSSIFADRDHHTIGVERRYLLVPSNSPREALAAKLRASSAPDLCIRSPSEQARHAAETASAGAYVRTIVEPLLARRYRGETIGDFMWRCADALRTLYAFDTRTALVVYDELPGAPASTLELEEHDLLRIADELERIAQVAHLDAAEAASLAKAEDQHRRESAPGMTENAQPFGDLTDAGSGAASEHQGR